MWFYFEPWHLLCFVILGSVVGWLARRAFPGRGLGLRGNVAVAVGGAFVGGLLFYSDLFYVLVDRLFGGLRSEPHCLLQGVADAFFCYFLSFVILGGLVGWLVGRALLGFRWLGNIYLGVIGAAVGIILFRFLPFGYLCLVTTVYGALVCWLAGRAFLGFGRLGNVSLGVVGAVAGGLLFSPVVTLLGTLLETLFAAFVGAVLSLATVIIFVRRR